MYPHPAVTLMGQTRAKFVGYTTIAGAGTLTFHASAIAGDLALVISTTPTITGWTTASQGSLYMHWKVLTVGDLASPPTVAGGVSIVAIYRGPLSASKRSEATLFTSGQLTIGGFVKSAGARAIVTAYRNFSSTNANAPTGFAARVANFNAGSGNGIGLADILTPPEYTDSASIIWTGLNGSTSVDGLGIELI